MNKNPFFKSRQDTSGFIYVATNPYLVGVVKIGMTGKKPADRVKALFNTSVPMPFILEYSTWVPDRYKAESYLHKLFDDKRVNKKREFFACTLSDAIKGIESNVPNLRKRKYKSRRRFKGLIITLVILFIGAWYGRGHVEYIVAFIKALVL